MRGWKLQRIALILAVLFISVIPALARGVTVTPTQLTFGEQNVNKTTVPKKVTLANHQKVTLIITNISITGDFAIVSNSCGSTLLAGQTCQVSVSFTPTAVGSRTGQLTFTDDDSNSPQVVPLSGSGVLNAGVAPTKVSFASQLITTTSAPKTVTLTNTTNATIDISSISVDGDFLQLGTTCGATLTNGSCTVSVVFRPMALGTRAGTLTFTDNATNSPQTVSLTGIGTATGLKSLVVSPLTPSTPLGYNVQFTATGNRLKGNPLDLTSVVTWSSTNDAVAAINGSGLAVSSGQGTTGISAVLDTLNASTNLTVTAPVLVSIGVTPASGNVALGTSQQYHAIGTYSDGTQQDLTGTAVWTSSPSGIANVLPTGLAMSLAQGTATITAALGGIHGSATLTVRPPALVALAVTSSSGTVPVGNTQQFTATGTYTDGTQQNLTQSSTWSSSDSSVVTIDNAGLATASAAGAVTITATASGNIQGSAPLTVTPILSRVPVRVCLTESETATSVSCTLNASVSAGNGLVVYVTSVAGLALPGGALQDTQSNNYAMLTGPVSGGYGSLYMGYSQLATALNAGDSVALNVTGSDSWGLSIYDIGPVQGNQADVGVSFQNVSSGPPDVINPATGMPGWWTGRTAATAGFSDMCMAAVGVGRNNGGTGAPAPITSYVADNQFSRLDLSQFYATSDPNYVNGGSVLALYAEAAQGTVAQSHITSYAGFSNTAPAVLYCFREGSGAVRTPPRFTGNYCVGSGSCTLNNVAAGDMLVVSAHTYWAVPPEPMIASDSQVESVIFDQLDGSVGLTTWHISPVANGGTHTITVTDATDPSILINVAEITGQASGNPVEAPAQNSYYLSSLASVSLTTTVANDLLYGWARSAQGTDEAPGFNAIRVAPTAEFAVAPAAGPQTVSVIPRGTPPWSATGIQAIGIRPAGSPEPPTLSPSFTGNYCIQTAGSACTIDNVAPGNLLIISAYNGRTLTQAPVVSDNLEETIVADRGNDSGGDVTLSTWHIASVALGGSHTITVAPANAVVVTEFAAQSLTDPIDAVSASWGASGPEAVASVQTTQGNDLIYAWCGAYSNTGWADGFAALTISPTLEYRMAAPVPGTESANCPLSNTSQGWVIQELAIRH